jgi:SAM-dependent methyltransferase
MMLQDARGGRYLDIGCGEGWALDAAPAAGMGFAVGIDTDEAALKKIRNDNRNIVVASALQLPFKSQTFDTVSAWDVIEHLPEGQEWKMFSEIASCLHSKGIVLLSVPCNNVLSNTLDPAWWIGHRHYTKSDIYKMTQSGNFQIIRLFIRGGIIDAIGTIIYYMNTWFFRNIEIINTILYMARDFDYARGQGFTTLFGIIKFDNT